MKHTNDLTFVVYKKSLALKDISTAIANYFSGDPRLLGQQGTTGLRNDIAHAIFTDASLISSILEGATKSSHSIRYKHIKFIGIMTRNIFSYCNGLEKDGIKEKEYLLLLRKELRGFRNYFKQLRKSLIATDD